MPRQEHGHRPGRHLSVARCPGSIVPPDAVPHRGWRLLLVQALHSLLGNLPSHNTSPRQEHSTGRSPLCPLTAQACHGPPAACASGLAVCPRAPLHLLYTAATPAASPAASSAAPLPARGAGPAPWGTCLPLWVKPSERERKHTQRTQAFTSCQNQPAPFCCLHLQLLACGAGGCWLLPAPLPASDGGRGERCTHHMEPPSLRLAGCLH